LPLYFVYNYFLTIAVLKTDAPLLSELMEYLVWNETAVVF